MNGYDTAWVNNDTYSTSSTSTFVPGTGLVTTYYGVDTVTNYTWEWWGAQAWDLPGFNGASSPTGFAYENGQYGPNKKPRDFTDASNLGADGNPVPRFNGTVPAFHKQMWTAPYVGSFNRTDTGKNGETGPSGAGDYFLEINSNYNAWNIVEAPLAGTDAQNGARIKLSYDAYGTDNRTRIRVYGMNDYNDIRKPFTGDCVDTEGTPFGTETVYAGPDIATAWGGLITGELLADTRDNSQPLTADWASASQSFFLTPPSDGRSNTNWDSLGIRVYGYGTAGFDNIQLTWIQAGDANEDLDVDLADFSALTAGWGANSEWASGDFDQDGDVDLADFSALTANWGDYSASASSMPGITVTPEPATMSLLGLGGLALLRRRKK